MGIWDRLVLVFARAIAREGRTTERGRGIERAEV
jgi:hypothetical protein